MEDEKVIINDQEMSEKQFQEVKEELKDNERLTEVAPGKYRKLERMNG